MNKLESMSFRKDFVLPVEEQDRMLGFIKWGKKNDYPFFLVDLFNGSAWHQGIIKNKTYYIAGGGLEVVSGELSRFIANSYTDFTMDEIVEQLAFDYELFGAFAVKGTWNKEGTRVAMWEYLGVDAIRISSDERMYYLSDDWTVQQQSAEKTNLRTLPALDENNKTGSFVLYYKDPAKKARKEHGVYPKPPYQGGITAIQTDCDISKFHMYELQNGFKSGTMITFMDGFPETQEEAESFKNQIKGPASNIENSGDIIITFAPSSDQAPKVENLTGNDLDKRYDMLQSSVQQNILVAHSVVAPSLFGVAPEGSFNAAESADLYEIFKKTYVEARQKRIEYILNYMVKLSGDTGTLKLKDVKPIGVAETAPAAAQPTAIDQPTAEAPVDVAKSALNGAQIASLIDVVAKIKEGILTPDSALQVVLASFPTIDEAQARRIVGMTAGPQQLSSCKFEHQDDEIGYFAQYGDPAHEFDVIATFPIAWDTPSADVFSKQDQLFATIGEIALELNDFDKNVLKMIGDGEDSNAIAKALNTNIEEIAKSMAKLMRWEVITKGEVTDLGKQFIQEREIPIERFEVRYGYRTRLDVPPAKTGSRQFCERLMDLNRLYTRDEINTISMRVDRDVWRYRGGWYTNPDTQASTPWCRHEWIQQLVLKR
jgi:predicted small secreted protein